MQYIQIDQSKEGLTRETASHFKGNVSNIMILSEDDMSLENLPLILDGKNIDILYVPDIPSLAEMQIIYPHLPNGNISRIKVI